MFKVYEILLFCDDLPAVILCSVLFILNTEVFIARILILVFISPLSISLSFNFLHIWDVIIITILMSLCINYIICVISRSILIDQNFSLLCMD